MGDVPSQIAKIDKPDPYTVVYSFNAPYLAVFDMFVDWAATPDFRGSPLVSATYELGGQLNAARPFAQAHAQNVERYFEDQAKEAGLHDPRGLAVQLLMLLEGASVVVLVKGDAKAAELARSAAASLIAGAAGG